MSGGVTQFLNTGDQPSQDPKTPWNVSNSYPLPVTSYGSLSINQDLDTIEPVVNVVGFLFPNAAAASPRLGARVINWLPTPIYIAPANATGLPGPDPVPGPGGAGVGVTAYSDYVPAYNASTGVPGQYCFPFAPQNQWYYLITGVFTAGHAFNVMTWTR